MEKECIYNESHGVKKHNLPKDKNAAMRKGNRDAEREMFGDGFKSRDRIHNAKGYDRREGKRVDRYFNSEEMDEGRKVVKLNEEDIKRMIREALNTAGRDINRRQDGRYQYLGTGSEESKDRVQKMHDKAYRSHMEDRHNIEHGESPFEKMKKERGPFEEVPDDTSEERWHGFIDGLRNLASRNDYSDPMQSFALKYYVEEIMTKEGAKSFLAYLYKNGFKKNFI